MRDLFWRPATLGLVALVAAFGGASPDQDVTYVGSGATSAWPSAKADPGPVVTDGDPRSAPERQVSRPGPVPIPHIEARRPGPVPMPQVEPRRPGPVPMPELGHDDTAMVPFPPTEVP